METSALARQMIKLQKTVFVNNCDGWTVLQDYSRNMMHDYMKGIPWMSDENRKVLEDSLECVKKVREDYKHAVDQGFALLEKMACPPKP